jgi:hypothetical protein
MSFPSQGAFGPSQKYLVLLLNSWTKRMGEPVAGVVDRIGSDVCATARG